MGAAILRLASISMLVAIFYVGVLLYQQQLGWTVEQKAALRATAWMDYFMATVEDPERFVATGDLDAERRAALETAQIALDVFRLKFYDADGRLTFSSEPLDPTASMRTTIPTRDARADTVLRTGEIVVELSEGGPGTGRPATYAEIYVPVQGLGGVIGVLDIYVDMVETRAVTEAALARFAAIFTVLALVALMIPTLHWLMAWREIRAKNDVLKTTARTQEDLSREVRLIGELNEWLQSSRSQTELFEMVVGFLTRLLPACEGEIYVYANSRDVLDGSAAWGGAEAHDHIYPEDCWSLRRGRTFAYGDSEMGFPCAHVGRETARPYFCLPLLAHGETIGLLHLRQREGADPAAFRASRRLGQLCAEQISMAIANVRMRDELQDQSIRDPLTGLFNRRHLTDALRRDMAHAARNDTSVALLSIDVDHFKKFNDNYGHDAGDMVLRAVGEVLDRATDGDEMACRPGGEEFMVILPDAEISEALHRAESIRERIQDISVRYGEKTLPSVTASIGIAISPGDGTVPQDLMRAADQALYAAKAGGRNRAVLTTLMGMEDRPDPAHAPPALSAAE
jgi:diguanylate cyclase (GGDEF)-like protein